MSEDNSIQSLRNNLAMYNCILCNTAIGKYKFSYYECRCTRVGIYTVTEIPENWRKADE